MNIPPPPHWIPATLAAALGAWVDSPYVALLALLALPGVWLCQPRTRLAYAATLAALWVGGAAAAWDRLAPPSPPLPLLGEVVAVTLKGDVEWVDVAPIGLSAWRVRARLVQRPQGLVPGAIVRLTGRLERPPPADNPGGFDAAAYAARDRVRWRLRGHLDLVEPGQRAPTLQARVGARRRLQRCPSQFGAGVLRGVLLGDRSAVPQDALVALEATGTGHLLAVSGVHIGGLSWVVFSIVGFLARRAQRVSPDLWGAAAAIPCALAYASLAQWPTSATRAAVMVTLYLLGRAIGRPSDARNLLAFAATATLIMAPQALFEPGFQLSFGAVAALVWARPGGGVLGAARVALVAAAATAPIQAAHFGTFAPLAVVANLVVTPLASLFLVPVSVIALLLEPVWPGALEWAADAATALVVICEAIAESGGGVWIVGTHWAPALAAPWVLVAGLGFAPRRACVLAVGLVLCPVLRGDTPSVTFLAVGQGDAILVRDGNHAMLVDAGPDPRAWALLGALRRAGVGHLDTLLVTHGHPDHFAGAHAVIKGIEVDRILFNGRPQPAIQWQQLVDQAQRERVPISAANDEVLRWPNATITLRANPASATAKENDASLVVRVITPFAAVLLTGDLEHAGEAQLLAEAPARVSVFKAGHHGSRTSTSGPLLAQLRPSAVVASCGRSNRFGFPHPEVRARLEAAGISLWRTDRDGAVRIDMGKAPYIEAAWRARISLEGAP